MASFSVMNVPVVRLQMPAGNAFVAAFVDAASKYASRRDFTPEAVETFVEMVRQSVDAMNSTSPGTIEFTVTEHADRVEAVTKGTDPSGPISSDAKAQLKAGASRCASMSIADDPPSVSFGLGLG